MEIFGEINWNVCCLNVGFKLFIFDLPAENFQEIIFALVKSCSVRIGPRLMNSFCAESSLPFMILIGFGLLACETEKSNIQH